MARMVQQYMNTKQGDKHMKLYEKGKQISS